MMQGRERHARAGTPDCTETVVEVAGAKVHVLQGGSGAPLLALHGVGGSQGWLRYHQALAEPCQRVEMDTIARREAKRS